MSQPDNNTATTDNITGQLSRLEIVGAAEDQSPLENQHLGHLQGIWDDLQRQKLRIDGLQAEKRNLTAKNEAQLEKIEALQIEKENLRHENESQRESIRSLQKQIQDLNSSKKGIKTEDDDLYRQSSGGIYNPSTRHVCEYRGYPVEVFEYTAIQVSKDRDWASDLQQLYALRQAKYPLDTPAREVEHKILKRWATDYTRHDIMDILVLLKVDIANIRAELKLREQRELQNLWKVRKFDSLLEEHKKLIKVANKQIIELTKIKKSHVKKSEALKVSQTELKEQKAIMKQKDETDQEAKISQLEPNSLLKMAFALLDRIREQDKPADERDEAIIDRGNVAAHGGNILVAMQRYANCSDEDADWFKKSYGFDFEAFSRVKNCPILQELADMRFQMKHYSRSIPNYYETKFEKIFQEVRSRVEEWDEEVLVDRTTKEISAAMDENFLEDKVTMNKIQILRNEHELAATKEKIARAKEWGARKARAG
ncbi:hypothetical protein OCU04_006447 [Sclerotinia nivalis]|uniref:Uncharacterized protein n=1 Tax=Sclerotinia nivalis TaxID=352851 RepID=A0A9X0ANX1_9HELO|nr:hypothetical protein OCU04_006447 [Sclerotinia nivalis]